MNDSYLVEQVGPVLRPLLARVCQQRPNDVVGFLVKEINNNKRRKEFGSAALETAPVCLQTAFYASAGACPQGFRLALTQEDFTPEWLSMALNAVVVSFRTKICTEGQTGSTVLCLEIKYGNDSDTKSRPKSVAVKMHGPSPEQRAQMAVLKLYMRELYIYDRLAPSVPVVMPKLAGMWYDDSLGFDNTQLFNTVMFDLNEEYTPYEISSNDKLPDQAGWQAIFAELAVMHAQFWESTEATSAPLLHISNDATAGAPAVFNLSEFDASTSMACGEFVPKWQIGIEKYMPSIVKTNPLERICMKICAGNGGKNGKDIYRAAMKRLEKAPLTVVHGDMNPGNIWKSKTGGRCCFADWQVTRAGPAAWDFITPILGMESGAPAYTSFITVVKEYYSQLCIARPAIRTDYPYESLIEHIKCCYLIFMQWIMTVLYNVQIVGADTGALTGEKKDFTFGIFMANTFRRWGEVAEVLSMDDFAKELLAEAE